MSLFTISQLCEGNLAGWAGLHKTLEDAQEFVRKERAEAMDPEEIEAGLHPDELEWECIGSADFGCWWEATDGTVLYQIVEHKQC